MLRLWDDKFALLLFFSSAAFEQPSFYSHGMSYDGIVPAVGQLLAFLVSKPFLVVQVVISCANSKVINLISVQWLESYFLNVIIVLCPYLVFFFFFSNCNMLNSRSRKVRRIPTSSVLTVLARTSIHLYLF